MEKVKTNDKQRSVMEIHLEKAKHIAKVFLMLELIPSQFPPLVYHPFFDTEAMWDDGEVFLSSQDPKRFEECRDRFYKTLIEPCESIRDILHIVRKPYMITYLKHLLDGKIITKKECGTMLAELWTLIEVNSHDANATKRQILSWLAAADKAAIMSVQEMAIYNALPNEVIVYRGCDKKSDTKAFSWTLEKDKAEWFAKRWRKKGKVFCAKVKKENVLAYMDGRNEAEVIVEYNKLFDVEEIFCPHGEETKGEVT